MTQQKQTRKSLLASGLSLLTCVALLLGTTFAWFTDNVTSGRNQITAGNLDVELYARDTDGVYQPVNENEALFDDAALWEPGHTEVVYLKVANEGTLALKYQLTVTVASETSGTNVDGEAFNLSDYLVFGQAAGATETIYKTRAAAQAAAGDTMGLNDYTKPGNLLSGEEEYIALVVYMPEGVGNKANYRTGTTAPSIQLGVSVVATQDTVESDSFGTDYDAGALYETVWDGKSADISWYSSEASEVELTTAEQLAGFAQLVNGGEDFAGQTVILSANMDLNGNEWIPIGQKGSGKFFKGVFDGNGKTVRGLKISPENNTDEAAFDGYAAFFGAVQDAVIRDLTVEGEVGAINAAGLVARANAGTRIENCTSNAAVNGSTKAGGIVCLTNTGGVTISNCTNNGSVTGGSSGLGGIAGYTNAGTIISGCTNTGAVGAADASYAGGIVGYASQSLDLVSDCRNTAPITASANAGGIAGIITAEGRLESCSNAGSIVAGSGNGGGIAGSAGNAVLAHCRNTGSVGGGTVGGVAGDLRAGTVEDCAGGMAAMAGADYAGRLVGAVYNQPHDVVHATLVIDDSNGDDYTSLPAVGVLGPHTAWAYLYVTRGTYQNMELTERGQGTSYIYDYPTNTIYHWQDGRFVDSGKDIYQTVYQVTPETAQAVLDGEQGSLDGSLVVFGPGEYGELVFGRPTNDAGSNTTVTDEQRHYYTRTIRDLVLTAEEGARISGLTASSGHVYGEGYDYVLDKEFSGSGYFLTHKFENIVFRGITFTGRVNIATSQADTSICGVTFDGCTFAGSDASNTSAQAVRYYSESNNGSLQDLTVKNCVFSTWYQGIYTHHIEGITVTGCMFEDLGHNAVAVQDQKETDHKLVVIRDNTFSHIRDRIIRFGNIGADTQIVIIGNTATDSGDGDGEVIKAQSLASGVLFNIHSNDWGGGSAAQAELTDRPL